MSKDLFMESRDKESNSLRPVRGFAGIRNVIAEKLNKVNEGETSVLKLYAELSMLKKRIQNAMSSIEEEAFDELSKHDSKTVSLYGFEITHTAGGYTYDYNHIPEIAKKQKELDEMKETAKQAFKMSQKTVSFDKDDGSEIVPAKGNPKKDSIKVKLSS